MPTLTVTKTYADSSILTEAMLDAIKSSLETFFNTTKIDTDNVQAGGLEIANLSATAQKSLVPTGAMFNYSAATPPAGYLLCTGAAVSRSTYAALFAVVSTTYGSGDGSTTFNLPDCRGRVMVGLDNMDYSAADRLDSLGGNADVLGYGGGTDTHTLTWQELGAHDHPITHTHSLNNHTHTGTTGTEDQSITVDVVIPASNDNDPTADGPLLRGTEFEDHDVTVTSGSATSHTHQFTTNAAAGSTGGSSAADTSPTGNDQPHNNLQPFLMVNTIIKF